MKIRLIWCAAFREHKRLTGRPALPYTGRGCEHGWAVRQDRTRNLLFFRILFLESSSRCLGYKNEEPDDLSIIGPFCNPAEVQTKLARIAAFDRLEKYPLSAAVFKRPQRVPAS